MRVAIVGAGVAGLTAALALQRDGHEVAVYEQAPELRTGGFAFNFWTNATSPLHALGVAIPGEPYDHLNIRAGGRHRSVLSLPTRLQPHMAVERGAILRALSETLPAGAVRFGTPISAASDLLADGADLVVAADGVGSKLRPDADRRQRISKPWPVWQAITPHGGELMERGAGAFILGRSRSYGIWRMVGGGLTWFVEDMTLPVDATAAEVLAELGSDPDPLVRAVADMSGAEQLRQWQARDRRPTRGVIGDRTVAIGDAAHPMLPCIGQGACTSIEDGIALTHALRQSAVQEALMRYRRRRLPVTWTRVATAHFACAIRQPSPLSAAIASAPVSGAFGQAAGLWMRQLNRVDKRIMRAITSAGSHISPAR